MTLIRPLEDSDLAAVASLYERVERSGADKPPPGLANAFRRQQLDQPWYDAASPSLVCEDDDGRIVGYLAVYARRFTIDGRPALATSSGPLVTIQTPTVAMPGLALTRAYLAGPQELSYTDGASPDMQRIWLAAGGSAALLASLNWLVALRPLSHLSAGRWAKMPGPVYESIGQADRLVRRAGRRRFPNPATKSAGLTPDAVLELLPRVAAGARLVPAYDEVYLSWLFEEMQRIERRGTFAARLVTDAAGKPLGWYLAYFPRGGVAQAIQIGARPADVREVLQTLFADAIAAGANAVSGRVDPHLVDELPRLSARFCEGARVLVHSRDADVGRAALTGRGFLSRADGEWWMAPHIDPFGAD